MELIFLDAGIPLTKSFSRNADGSLEKSAYPLVKNFTSHRANVSNANEFCDSIEAAALNGWCLLKGLIKRDLDKESRAGSTEPLQPTLWSCFDLDNVDGIESIADFVNTILPSAFRDVDYVVQYSASSGITNNKGVNAHLFFIHDTSFTPEAAKLFITELNLTNPVLAKQLELTAAGTALRYRLDRSVVQSDKLIYIAPPVLGPEVTSSLTGPRIFVVPGSKRVVTFDWKTASPPAAIEAALQAKVDELREAMGLGRKVARYRTVRGGEVVLSNPDRAVVTGEKSARGFTYINVNGGDSWGYYYATNNPRYLRNFKGEPTVILADFLPEYWGQIQERLVGKIQRRPFCFRHRPTDAVWNGVYDPVNDRIEDLAPTTRTNLPDFFGQFNLDAPAVIKDWELSFDPTRLTQVDFEKGFCNKWAPTEFIRSAALCPVAEVPPTIQRVIRHVLGNDETCYKHFLNWLAYIFQTRQKTTTAWVISGRQGTGKGVLFSQILSPLFGERYCVQKQLGALEDRFNAEMETAIIYNFDEGQVIDSAKTRQAYARFKNMITEEHIEIRAMRSNAMMVRSYTNFIVTSNDYDAIGIEETDRRFNVAPRQEDKILITLADIAKIKEELGSFAGFLGNYAVDIQQVRVALNNDAKARMREASQDWLEQMCEAVRNGNLSYFVQFHDTSAPSGGNLMAWSSYNEVIRRFVEGIGKSTVVTSSDLLAVYTYLSGNIAAPGKFTRMLSHKNLLSGTFHDTVKGKTQRGYHVTWTGSDEEVAEWTGKMKSVPAQRAA